MSAPEIGKARILRSKHSDYNELGAHDPTMSADPVSALNPALNVSRKAASIPALASVYATVSDEFAEVNRLIPSLLTSRVGLVEDIGAHIVESGGKRLRPLLVLLGAKALAAQGQGPVKLATVIEFLHTATLLHDDAVDRSDRRRGRATANAIWGNAPSVLVGDFLYSRAFQLMVELGNPEILRILSDATNTIAEGEVLQLSNIGRLDVTEGQYMETIRCKTALLFEAATHTAAVLASDSTDIIEALRRFGLHFGLAYQLVDDYMDYVGDSAAMGKNAGDDLAEGKLTLPVIHALAHADSTGRRSIESALKKGNARSLGTVRRIMEATGSLQYTRETALAQAERASDAAAALPPSEAREALLDLNQYCIGRLV